MMNEEKFPPDPHPSDALMQIANGVMVTQALGVVAKLGIADLIESGGERDVDELASASGSDRSALYRILRSLASIGVFTETSRARFAHTPVSRLLRSDVDGSMRSMAIFMAEPWHYNVWGDMLHSAKTGGTAWKATYGEEVFDWFQKHPAESEIFNKAMTDMSSSVAPALVAAYDFSGINVLADIAGGHGFLLSQILKANPALKGILFDMDHVIAGSAEMLSKYGVEDRIEAVAGDFFREVPAADAYIMKHIIHDWDDERSVSIMKNIHTAMNGDGKLLLLEMVVPEGNEPHPSKILDLAMLALPGGLERTEAEYADLFEAAGFRLNRIVPTMSPFSVVEAVKA